MVTLLGAPTVLLPSSHLRRVHKPFSTQVTCHHTSYKDSHAKAAQPSATYSRRTLLSSIALFSALQRAGEVKAFGIESVQLPFLPDSTGAAEAAKSKLEKAAAEFEKSDFLKGLKERSEQNKEKNKKEVRDKYCYRQAEMGVGDCAGLRLIPGMTKSGLQKEKTPERKFLEFLTGAKDEGL
ncbi:hypothetical protein COCSUDRAFT_52498 [Coccomyxa subellipsoidea C-169]|uniref:Uncharacterized protein n=1 Tax=Coccomyxa subellipsoidea (strain C-169) TaxID=574566 RepID=I0Z8F5_COCSC|nr:hypothetical protein COCSUDRAFT_52498 [Coccomyxa subellipsoidea C-169]EIE26924.1 hypothetical protein COCSUDRAFT_52498 [Coccomyxa subellipsoidea C-169]|eukprot:XP_005651468.1 hypothetical protein COCSUDRAFT_52498 [Coccomyxa subellipsoidea C-169]